MSHQVQYASNSGLQEGPIAVVLSSSPHLVSNSRPLIWGDSLSRLVSAHNMFTTCSIWPFLKSIQIYSSLMDIGSATANGSKSIWCERMHAAASSARVGDGHVNDSNRNGVALCRAQRQRGSTSELARQKQLLKQQHNWINMCSCKSIIYIYIYICIYIYM